MNNKRIKFSIELTPEGLQALEKIQKELSMEVGFKIGRGQVVEALVTSKKYEFPELIKLGAVMRYMMWSMAWDLEELGILKFAGVYSSNDRHSVEEDLRNLGFDYIEDIDKETRKIINRKQAILFDVDEDGSVFADAARRKKDEYFLQQHKMVEEGIEEGLFQWGGKIDFQDEERNQRWAYLSEKVSYWEKLTRHCLCNV
ncbi:MAG: hypothetical protein LBN34_05395 [Clostridiales Family XIII bacterium]|jgi:hypothetical protein|nr:hypothetical protein [Clostridiales Family XIII bacterium]